MSAHVCLLPLHRRVLFANGWEVPGNAQEAFGVFGKCTVRAPACFCRGCNPCPARAAVCLLLLLSLLLLTMLLTPGMAGSRRELLGKRPGCARKVPGSCPRDAREKPGKCLGRAREVPEMCPGGVREVSGRCPGNARELPGKCPGGARELLFGRFSVVRRPAAREF